MKSLLLIVICLLFIHVYPQRTGYECPQGNFWNNQRCLPCRYSSANGFCTCTQLYQCDQLICNSGYYPHNGSCELGCSETCNVCGIQNNAELCYSCYYPQQSFALIGNICVQTNTSSNCVKFNPKNNLCEQCAAGYYLTLKDIQSNSLYSSQNDSSQNPRYCAKCLISNCGQCDSSYSCSLCNKGYQLKAFENKPPECVSCQDLNCLDCPETLNKCANCSVGYYLTETNTCSPCNISNCKSCNASNQCTQCSQGYYPDSNQCKKCISNCIQCQDANTCSICAPGIQLSKNKCLACPQSCQECGYDNDSKIICFLCHNSYYLDENQNCQICTKVDPYAERCAGPYDSPSRPTLQPTQCQNVYFLAQKSDGTFKCVTQNTDSCLVMAIIQKDNQYLCEECLPGYILLQNKSCKSCSSLNYCKQCELTENGLDIQCSVCMQYTYLNENKSCISCPNFCVDCTGGNCTKCFSGYYLNSNNNCVKCSVPYCSVCDEQVNICQECSPGYFKISNSDNQDQCNKCPQDCKTCSSPGNTCDSCNYAYGYVKQGNGCVLLQQAHCISVGEDGFCQTCDYGYYLNKGHCLKCISLNSGFVCRENVYPASEESEEEQVDGIIIKILVVICLMMV